MKPGEIITKQNTEIILNEDRNSITLKVSNSGDRPIQVGSHYHFAESNEFLKFDREKAKGMRLRATKVAELLSREDGPSSAVRILESLLNQKI